MAASPIYQKAKLVQFGFTNSHPDFTKGGDYMWSNSVSQADEQPLSAAYAVKRLGLKRIAVLHLNTDWGRTSKDIFVKAAKDMGAEVVAVEGYLADEKDFRSTLVRVRDAKPDGLMLISYYSDGALIARQVQAVGPQPADGRGELGLFAQVHRAGRRCRRGRSTRRRAISPSDPRPQVRNFVTKFKAKYDKEPDAFNAYAYDTIILMAQVMREFGIDRKSIHDGLAKMKDVPSVIFGKATFDPADAPRRRRHERRARRQGRPFHRVGGRHGDAMSRRVRVLSSCLPFADTATASTKSVARPEREARSGEPRSGISGYRERRLSARPCGPRSRRRGVAK